MFVLVNDDELWQPAYKHPSVVEEHPAITSGKFYEHLSTGSEDI